MKESSSPLDVRHPAGAFLAALILRRLSWCWSTPLLGSRGPMPWGRFAFFHRPIQLRGSSESFAARFAPQPMTPRWIKPEF